MNSVTRCVLKHIAKWLTWNYRSNRALHQRPVLLEWYRIMRDALTDEVEDNSGVLREMAQDAHEKVWGRGA